MQMILIIINYALFVIFEKAAKFKMSSAANFKWPFMGKDTTVSNLL